MLQSGISSVIADEQIATNTSILTDKFSGSSDIDFVVAFNDINLFEYADNYFDMKSSLEKLLQIPIDLLEDTAVKTLFYDGR